MAQSDRVLVTGASGFVGSAIARALLKCGYRVRTLVRASSARNNLADIDVEVAEGDVRDRDAVVRATRGIRFAVHAAADYRLWVPSPDDMLAINVSGTLEVMRAALAAGVERIVFTSSVATLAPGLDGCVADESARVAEDDAIGPYKRSKLIAEREVETMIARQSLPAIIVHPSTPIGPRDIRPTPTGRVVVEAARGRIPAFVDTGLNVVHVDDVAAGHVAALERGTVGEHYILGGQNIPLAELLGEIARQTGGRAPHVRLPRRLLYPAALVTESLARMTRREPLLTLDGLRMARRHMYYSSDKAERELGYHARPYRIAVADAIAWFRAAGHLR